jgi:hypothetical protein
LRRILSLLEGQPEDVQRLAEQAVAVVLRAYASRRK